MDKSESHTVRFASLGGSGSVPSQCDATNFMEPWTYTTASAGNIDSKVIRMLLLMAEIHQLIGTVVYPIIYRVLYIPGGAGFLPSTVSVYVTSTKTK